MIDIELVSFSGPLTMSVVPITWDNFTWADVIMKVCILSSSLQNQNTQLAGRGLPYDETRLDTDVSRLNNPIYKLYNVMIYVDIYQDS